MTILEKVVPVYLDRFKKEYEELEKKWIADGKPGFERQKWLRDNIPFAFSKDNIEKLSREDAIEIFSNFSTIGPHKTENDRLLAERIVDRDVVNKVKELLHGSSDFSNKYSDFLDKERGTKDVGEGITSEILCYFNPRKYGIISAPSTKALRILGLGNFSSPKTGKQVWNYAKEYFDELQTVLIEFKKDTDNKDADFIDLDYFLYFISQSKIWQIAGGRDGQSWSNGTWQRQGIAGYGTTGIEEKYKDKICSADKEALAKMYTDVVKDKSPGYDKRVAALLDYFINKVGIGDIFVANQGKTSVLGFGVVSSGPKYSENRFEGDPQVYREVLWVRDVQNLQLPIPYEITSQFDQAISLLNFKQFQKIFPTTEIPDPEKLPKKTGGNTIDTTDIQILELLKNKKQIILYGPPGTGKTYTSIIRAHEIIFGENNPNITYRTLQNKLKTQPKSEIDVFQLNWIKAIILSFNEIPTKKVQVNEIKNSQIITRFSLITNNHNIRSTIWDYLSKGSRLDSENVKIISKNGSEYFDKDTESNWYLTEKGKDYQKTLLEDLKDAPSTSSSQFSFVTFHQSFSYEDFVEGIRPEISEEENSPISYRIKPGIFKEICKKAELDPTNNYVLIIDEINRGNISKIFGELITLLEDNKRAGETEEITVRLPYSGEDFCVPNNVYIIGTMNSTDKSIALVDVALRRRFHFERLNVNYELIPNEDAKKFLIAINSIICALKNPDYEIGHFYFMNIKKNDDGNQELKKVFSNRILPLFEEYFFNDWEALATILGSASIRIDPRKKMVWDDDTGKFNIDSGDYDQIYGRCIKSSDIVFENTMNNLGIRPDNSLTQQ